MKKKVYFIMIICTLFLVGCGTDITRGVYVIPEEVGDCELPDLGNGYKVVWCDEFNYEGLPDSTKWGYDIGTGSWGWGNNEAQYYTNRLDNVKVSDGNLTITAKKESYNGSQYTSARLVTRQKGDWKYGFIEVRAKLPSGKGTWPAIWMLPTTYQYGAWPNSGEIDIMEAVGNNPDSILGTVHTGSFNHTLGTQKGSNISVSNSTEDFNLYQLEWTEDFIKIAVNNKVYFTFNNTESWKTLENGYMFYPFDQDFHLLLNIAMGGTLGGNIDSNFQEASMVVDYVRVYQKVEDNETNSPDQIDTIDYTASGSTISLEWEAPNDDFGVRYYEIILDNKHYSATNKTKYTISGLNPSTKYSVNIIAVDWNDNYSISKRYVITTSQATSLPGIINAISYLETDSGTVTNGSSGAKVLSLNGNDNVSYEASSKSGTYTITINASVLKSVEMSIYVVKGEQETLIASKNLTATYGKYDDIVISDNVSFTNDDVTLLIKLEGDDVTSLLLNTINIS